MEGTKLRLFALVVTASLIGLVFASAAKADTVNASNGAVAITASLMNGTNGAFVSPGSTISAAASVTNMVGSADYVRIYAIASWDHGWSPNMNKLKKLKDGDTWDLSGKYTVPLFTPSLTVFDFQVITISPGIIDPLVADATITVL